MDRRNVDQDEEMREGGQDNVFAQLIRVLVGGVSGGGAQMTLDQLMSRLAVSEDYLAGDDSVLGDLVHRMSCVLTVPDVILMATGGDLSSIRGGLRVFRDWAEHYGMTSFNRNDRERNRVESLDDFVTDELTDILQVRNLPNPDFQVRRNVDLRGTIANFCYELSQGLFGAWTR